MTFLKQKEEPCEEQQWCSVTLVAAVTLLLLCSASAVTLLILCWASAVTLPTETLVANYLYALQICHNNKKANIK